MPTMFEPEVRRRMVDRLGRLGPDTPARWGRMNAPQMIWHLNAQLRHLLGEFEARRRPGPMGNPVLRWLIIDVLPWPRGGAPSAPEFLAFAPGAWERDVADLTERLERWTARGEGTMVPEHPAFGALDGRTMGRLLWKHWNHHLTQFGA
jgi:hypothetical protein